jgi:uncharacterized protein (DUF302 family)
MEPYKPDAALTSVGPAPNPPEPPNRSSRVRRWMTSSLAVVMASLAGTAAMASSSANLRASTKPLVNAQGASTSGEQTVRRFSPYGLEETVRRIEQAAAEQGLPVLASVAPAASPSPATEPAAPWVIVLSSSEGGTPVVMHADQTAPAVPLAVHVHPGPDGKAVVELPLFDIRASLDEMRGGHAWPDTVVDELAGLPTIVEMALN